MRPSLHGFFGSGVAINFRNGDFINIAGWTILSGQVKLNGLTNIAGWPTPTDPTQSPPGEGGSGVGDGSDAYIITTNYEFSTTELPPGFSAPQRSLRLWNSGSSIGFGIVHGPAVFSQDTVHIQGGSIVEFWWRALAGGDAYDVFAYLLNVDDGSTITLLNNTGPDDNGVTAWALNSIAIPPGIAGDYRFVFIAGSFDYTGGTVYGGSLYITGVKVKV